MTPAVAREDFFLKHLNLKFDQRSFDSYTLDHRFWRDERAGFTRLSCGRLFYVWHLLLQGMPAGRMVSLGGDAQVMMKRSKCLNKK